MWGLSPLARGKPSGTVATIGVGGPIPAGAGETRRRRSSSPRPRAYPRWRGGNNCRRTQLCWRSGLSPLARGKHSKHLAHIHIPGPIPAGAGETMPGTVLFQALWAYPRWRGGNVLRVVLLITSLGLSPLARGKHRHESALERREGPIPAGAGETNFESDAAGLSRAYPRWRGGNRNRITGHIRDRGLSPLARGKRIWAGTRRKRMGPIPAGAGETCVWFRRDSGGGAYPRWRGGNEANGKKIVPGKGLSPLARGKRARRAVAGWGLGPIPAGAGETYPVPTRRC